MAESTNVHEGVKIGGRPYWAQGPQGVRGEFLCALGPVTFLPQESAGQFRSNSPRAPTQWPALNMGDAATLNFFLSDDGDISWTFDCY